MKPKVKTDAQMQSTTATLKPNKSPIHSAIQTPNNKNLKIKQSSTALDGGGFGD
jgi:hypothetical protein